MRNPLRRPAPTPEVRVVTEQVSPAEHARIFSGGWDACLAQIREADDPDAADRLFEDRLRQERYDLLVRTAQTEPDYSAAMRLMDAARAELEAGPVKPMIDLQPFRDVLTALRQRRTETGGGVRDTFAYCVSLLETALDQATGDPT